MAIARDQLASARENDCTVSGYLWAYWADDPTDATYRALRVAEGFDLTVLWLDCEDQRAATPETTLPWLTTWEWVTADEGYTPGIYTAPWWWQPATADSRAFSHLPLWLPNYNERADLHFPQPFGGWTVLAGHQYTDDPLDLNVFDARVTD